MLEFFVSADVGAAWEFKPPVGYALDICALFLFGFIEDIVVVTLGGGLGVLVLGRVGRDVREVCGRLGGVVGLSGVE